MQIKKDSAQRNFSSSSSSAGYNSTAGERPSPNLPGFSIKTPLGPPGVKFV